jgi:hypothetical protein
MIRRSAAISDRIGSRAMRRAIVVALYGGGVLYGTIMVFAQPFPRTMPLRVIVPVIALAALIATAVGFCALLRPWWVNAPHLDESALDERMIARRNDSVFRAQGLMAQIFGLEVIAWGLFMIRGVPLDPNLATAFLWSNFILAWTLSSAVLAWTEPDQLP